MDFSAYAFSSLREGQLTLHRGLGERQESILLVGCSDEYPAPGSLRRLEHEHALRADLDVEWAARPVELVHREGRLTLVLEDPGGEPLERILGRPMDVTQFLRISIPLAAAVGGMHARGLIHRDLQPANILVDGSSGGVRLTGFGIASRLPRERQVAEPPEVIAGTLAYMAPEQTGRMNRSVDSRSDLYSCGVILYQMLTGVLPFSAADPMEWIHCHIARQPTPPSVRLNGVPAQLSAIVMKLLAKSADDRYRTASGLRADLRRCQAQWEAYGRIEPFPLGMQDASDRLLIPERLYGREREIDVLLAAFDRVAAGGATELVLVSGFSGIGKSSVVNELHKALVPTRGLFASGKFDQYKRDIPYATIAQAFQTLVRPILGKDEVELGEWRDALRAALGANGGLIVNLVPELELVIGKQPPIADLPPQDAKNRFQMVFRRFLGVFARKEHPLALFLDDLQWLDAATLELIEHLVTRPEVGSLLLIGAYRDNEAGPAHPLLPTLEAIRAAGARVHEITLAPLGLDDIGQLVADALHCEAERVAPLAQVVHEKTAGNPFFAIQFISALDEEALLAFEYDAAQWSWDLNRIHAKGYTDNVVDLMVEKLNRLRVETQKALQEFACLGNSAEIATLSIVRGTSASEVDSVLWEAVRLEFIARLEGSYKFVHDRVQEAAYSLIPAESRAEAHLRIGKLLAKHTPPERREEAIFEIVNQVNRGAALIISQEERDQIAELNLIAGRRAKASMAYASALKYLIAGAALLTDDCWRLQHELAFALELQRAECEFLTGEHLVAADRLTLLSSRAANTVEQATVACLRVDVYTTLDQGDRAVAVCLDYLRHLAVEWSPHPTAEEARREYERIWSLLGSRAIEELMELPLMSDPASLATLDVLTKLVPPALYTDANLVSLASCRAVNLSLEGGNSDGSCVAYAWLGAIAGPHFDDYKAGFQFGRLGYELVEQRGLKRFQARTYMGFGSHVVPWTKHIQAGRDLIRRAFEVANKIGDLTVAAYSCDALNTNLLASGDPLPEVQREAEQGLEFVQKAQFGIVIDIITAQLGLIRTLRGLTPKFGSFDDGQFEELRFERHLASEPVLALPECWYWIRKLQARFVAGDHGSAVDASLRAQRLLWTSPSLFETAEYHFYGALSHAASWDYGDPEQRQQHFQALVAHHRQLEAWAENCPANFENRAALVGAEIARIEGRALDAMDLYEQAIRSAHANGFVNNEALANELAGRFYLERGLEKNGDAHLGDAHACYALWGADGKVRQLERLYPKLTAREGRRPTATIGAPVQQLDAAIVVKASQAVSGEIVLPKLIETLMTIALEHAGAQRGLLVLMRGDTPHIEAAATTDQKAVMVTVRPEAVTPAAIPESLLNTVIRMRQSVILDDASAQNPFSADEYIREKRARSILCLPLLKQTRLIGVLYLENSLASHVFTPARISLLELLASQAAISLENARLYGELMMSEERWRKLFESVPVGVALMGSDGRYGSANPAFQRMTGYSEAELRHLSPLDITHEDDRAASEAIVAAYAAGRPYAQHIDKRYRRKDGGITWAEIFPAPIAGRADYPDRIAVDITERKRAEEALRVAQTELAHAARLTTLGQLTASIAHEINQPLAGIASNGAAGLNWLNRAKPDLDQARDAFSRIVRDSARASDVIRGMRALAKKSGSQSTMLVIDDLIRDVLTLTGGELRRHGVLLRTKLASSASPILADRVQLQQVLLNLIMNGVEAMSGVAERARELMVSSSLAEPGSVLVSVEDTGVGLDSAVAQRIFEPFFTTKPEGLGMGLSICRSIVEGHRGRLWASPREPHGAAIWFTIPIEPA